MQQVEQQTFELKRLYRSPHNTVKFFLMIFMTCINDIHDPPPVSACFLVCRSVLSIKWNRRGRTLHLHCWHLPCQGCSCYIPASFREVEEERGEEGRGWEERGGEGNGEERGGEGDERGREGEGENRGVGAQMVVHSTLTRATCRTQ